MPARPAMNQEPASARSAAMPSSRAAPTAAPQPTVATSVKPVANGFCPANAASVMPPCLKTHASAKSVVAINSDCSASTAARPASLTSAAVAARHYLNEPWLRCSPLRKTPNLRPNSARFSKHRSRWPLSRSRVVSIRIRTRRPVRPLLPAGSSLMKSGLPCAPKQNSRHFANSVERRPPTPMRNLRLLHSRRRAPQRKPLEEKRWRK